MGLAGSPGWPAVKADMRSARSYSPRVRIKGLKALGAIERPRPM